MTTLRYAYNMLHNSSLRWQVCEICDYVTTVLRTLVMWPNVQYVTRMCHRYWLWWYLCAEIPKSVERNVYAQWACVIITVMLCEHDCNDQQISG